MKALLLDNRLEGKLELYSANMLGREWDTSWDSLQVRVMDRDLVVVMAFW